MSHVVTIKPMLYDPSAIRAACARLGLEPPQHGEGKIFTNRRTGQIVKLPGWKYPLVCDTRTGEVHYDNYKGRWREQKQLDRFLQAYSVEKAKIEARKQGHSVAEQSLKDGSVKLTIQVRGG